MQEKLQTHIFQNNQQQSQQLDQEEKNFQSDQCLPRYDFEIQKQILQQVHDTNQREFMEWIQQQQQINQFVSQQLPSKKQQKQQNQQQNNENVSNINMQDIQNFAQMDDKFCGQIKQCRRDMQLKRMLEIAEYVDSVQRLELQLELLEQKLEELQERSFKQKITKQFDHLQSPGVLISNLINQNDDMME
eukprot:TRINITY_DN1829_c0_g4_i2.p2 TRINITY_DN1829_c0_g4~~TRINITY_DN1829_c0_g4_i2.p2  ORF type:complete len:205 (+),score=34.65 TRINITY_DN1829_c0_g4_i2:51-617(+)